MWDGCAAGLGRHDTSVRTKLSNRKRGEIHAPVAQSSKLQKLAQPKDSTRTMSMVHSSISNSCPKTTQRKKQQMSATNKGGGSRDAARSATCTTARSYCMPNVEEGCPAHYKPPYMDVQTVKTNLMVDQKAMLENQAHCMLLVEPVLLPDLGHTGVTRETLPGDRRLFYPNGHKNCGLGATVRNALYEASSARVCTGDNSKTCGGRHREPRSDWAGSSAYFSLSDCSSSKRSDASAAIPAGQGGRFPTDVWGTPRAAGAAGNRRPRTLKTTEKGVPGRRTGKQGETEAAEGGQRGGGGGGGGGDGGARQDFMAQSKVDATRMQKQKTLRQQEDFQSSGTINMPSTGSKSSTTLSTGRVSLASGWKGPTGVDAAGRDSEWLAERRAADREAKEVLDALKHNNNRLWFLVGGGV